MSTFSDNLQKARKSKGWSQEQTARLLNIKRPRLASYLEGRAQPPLELFTRICEVFGIVDWNGFINNANFDINKQSQPSPPPTLLEQRYRVSDIKTKNLVKQLLNLP